MITKQAILDGIRQLKDKLCTGSFYFGELGWGSVYLLESGETPTNDMQVIDSIIFDLDSYTYDDGAEHYNYNRILQDCNAVWCKIKTLTLN